MNISTFLIIFINENPLEFLLIFLVLFNWLCYGILQLIICFIKYIFKKRDTPPTKSNTTVANRSSNEKVTSFFSEKDSEPIPNTYSPLGSESVGGDYLDLTKNGIKKNT